MIFPRFRAAADSDLWHSQEARNFLLKDNAVNKFVPSQRGAKVLPKKGISLFAEINAGAPQGSCTIRGASLSK
jgi:hypothetical protein